MGLRPTRGKTRAQALEGIVERIAERADREAKPEAGKILTATYVLSTMHAPLALVQGVFKKMFSMQELPGYQAILDEGAVKQMRKTIRKLGESRFGPPADRQASKLDLIEDLERLERMALAILTANDWDELLAVK